jgi:hypothetical protein
MQDRRRELQLVNIIKSSYNSEDSELIYCSLVYRDRFLSDTVDIDRAIRILISDDLKALGYPFEPSWCKKFYVNDIEILKIDEKFMVKFVNELKDRYDRFI